MKKEKTESDKEIALLAEKLAGLKRQKKRVIMLKKIEKHVQAYKGKYPLRIAGFGDCWNFRPEECHEVLEFLKGLK